MSLSTNRIIKDDEPYGYFVLANIKDYMKESLIAVVRIVDFMGCQQELKIDINPCEQ